MANYKPNSGSFKKGDPRINRKGRPKNFDAFRELAQQVAHEIALKDGLPLVVNGKVVTITEAILRSWAHSRNPKLQIAFIEIAYGKVANQVNLSAVGNLVIEWDEVNHDGDQS